MCIFVHCCAKIEYVSLTAVTIERYTWCPTVHTIPPFSVLF